jgi:hypothetical protein
VRLIKRLVFLWHVLEKVRGKGKRENMTINGKCITRDELSNCYGFNPRFPSKMTGEFRVINSMHFSKSTCFSCAQQKPLGQRNATPVAIHNLSRHEGKGKNNRREIKAMEIFVKGKGRKRNEKKGKSSQTLINALSLCATYFTARQAQKYQSISFSAIPLMCNATI